MIIVKLNCKTTNAVTLVSASSIGHTSINIPKATLDRMGLPEGTTEFLCLVSFDNYSYLIPMSLEESNSKMEEMFADLRLYDSIRDLSDIECHKIMGNCSRTLSF